MLLSRPRLGQEFLAKPAQAFHIHALRSLKAVGKLISDRQQAHQQVELLRADLAS